MTNHRFHVAIACGAGILLASQLALSADLPLTKAREQAALIQGVGKTAVAALERRGIAGQNEVANTLATELRPGSSYESRVDAGILRLSGDQWSLEVSSDGTSASFRDLKVEALAHSLGKPLIERMGEAQLEQKGRAFIAANLANQIALGTGEELVALRADYRSEGGQDLTTGVVSSAVVANRIVFTRTINGVPVVGNGSKVYVTFTNDGSIESFRFDWPRYVSGAPQMTAVPSEILSRVQQVVSVRSGDALGALVAVPQSGTNAYPLTLTANTQLEGMDCGYYDAGAGLSKARSFNSVQLGCTYRVVGRDANGMRMAYAGAVPAGATFVADSSWLETQILRR